MKNFALAAVAVAFAATGAFAQQGAEHDHSVSQTPVQAQPTTAEHDHGAAAPQGRSMDGKPGMGGMSGMGGMDHMKMMEPTAANPFPPTEMKMHMAMMHAAGADATETYARKMVEHHRGAIEMSKLLLANSQDPTIKKIATSSIVEQGREIDAMQAWLKQNGKPAQ